MEKQKMQVHTAVQRYAQSNHGRPEDQLERAQKLHLNDL